MNASLMQSMDFTAHKPHPLHACTCIFTACKQSLQRLCFHRCLSTGGSWSLSGRDCLHPGGLHPGVSVQGVSVKGSLSKGVSIEGSLSRGVSITETPGQRPPPPYSNEQVVHILLECILVQRVVANGLVTLHGTGTGTGIDTIENNGTLSLPCPCVVSTVHSVI